MPSLFLSTLFLSIFIFLLLLFLDTDKTEEVKNESQLKPKEQFYNKLTDTYRFIFEEKRYKIHLENIKNPSFICDYKFILKRILYNVEIEELSLKETFELSVFKDAHDFFVRKNNMIRNHIEKKEINKEEMGRLLDDCIHWRLDFLDEEKNILVRNIVFPHVKELILNGYVIYVEKELQKIKEAQKEEDQKYLDKIKELDKIKPLDKDLRENLNSLEKIIEYGDKISYYSNLVQKERKKVYRNLNL